MHTLDPAVLAIWCNVLKTCWTVKWAGVNIKRWEVLLFCATIPKSPSFSNSLLNATNFLPNALAIALNNVASPIPSSMPL